MAKKDPEIVALENWINVNDDTRDIYKRYGGDFWFILPIIQKRIMEEGTDKYVNMSDKEIDDICRKIKEESDKERVDENGHKVISIWQDYNERDAITMIKAFTQLNSDNKRLVLSVKGLWS